MSAFASVTDALELLVPPFDADGDWEAIAAQDPPAPTRRRTKRRALAGAALLLAAIALLATPAFGLQGLVRDLFGRKNVSFSHSTSAPNEVKKEFEDLAIGAPARWAPEALAAQARTAGTFVVAGHPRRLWVVPTRRGGYCYRIERSILGCRQKASDRAVGGKGQFGVSYYETGGSRALPGVTRIAGDVTAPRAARITIHYADGTTADVPFIWVSKPIAAGFFSYDVPTAHWTAKLRAVSVTLQAGDGHRLSVQTFEYRRERPVRPIVPSRIRRLALRVLPTAPPIPPSEPTQRGTADGFTVVVGANGAVQFTETAPTPGLRRLDGHSAGFNCFRLTREFGILTLRGLGQGGRFAARVGFRLDGVGRPVDGCEVQASGGHRWPDANNSHSAVEIPLTPAGAAYFADRAAARDLALFVRSKRMHMLRHEAPRVALRDIRATYGAQLRTSRIRIAVRSARELVFNERSRTGKTFTVVVRDGRIAAQNLKPFGFVF